MKMHNINNAMAWSESQTAKPRWIDLEADLLSATADGISPAIESKLLEILRFEGKLQLDEASDMPHSMAPETMLKSLAVQILARWTGTKYFECFRRLQCDSCLRDVIQAVIAN